MAGIRKAEYIPSQKGAPQVLLDGYLYAKNKVKGETVYWRCVDKFCQGKCTTVSDFIRNTSEHNHPPKDERELMFVGTLRKRAREETTPMQQVYNNTITQQEDNIVPNLPSFHSMKSAMYRHRRQNIPPLPGTLAEVVLPDTWTTTQDGRRFLLFSDGEEDKILVFCTDEGLEALQSADKIFMDGTFSSCPPLWNQLYIIHAMFSSTMYPLVYALLPNRQRATYVRLFSLLKIHTQRVLNRPLEPAMIQTDFELAAIQAAEIEFQQAEIKGCLIHFCQGLWRKTQELGLAVAYKEDPEVKKWIRRAAGLPLLPLAQVQDAWVEAMEQCPEVNQAQQMHDYVVSTWVDDNARFPPRLWNHHETQGPRTNNNLEGFHSRISKMLQHFHPNIYRFIELIQKVELAERAKLAQINFGAAPPPKKIVYREKENRLVRLKEQLMHREKSPLQFLDAVGPLMMFK